MAAIYTKRQIKLLDTKCYEEVDSSCLYTTTYELLRGYSRKQGEAFAVTHSYKFSDLVNLPTYIYIAKRSLLLMRKQKHTLINVRRK
jgi:hypothetical protein